MCSCVCPPHVPPITPPILWGWTTEFPPHPYMTLVARAIRANRFARIIRNWHPYFYSANRPIRMNRSIRTNRSNFRFARITPLSTWPLTPVPASVPASNCATYPWEELPLKKCPNIVGRDSNQGRAGFRLVPLHSANNTVISFKFWSRSDPVQGSRSRARGTPVWQTPTAKSFAYPLKQA